MKKILAFGIVALLTSLSVAQATESEPKHERLFRFDFNCEFSPLKTPVQGGTFEAAARVFANVREDHGSAGLENVWENTVQAENLRNLLAVARDGSLFYADGALLVSTPKKVEIAAANGQKLAIIIPRHDHDSVNAEWMNYQAFLAFDDHFIAGVCKVRARPVEHGHEYDDENAPIAQGAALN